MDGVILIGDQGTNYSVTADSRNITITGLSFTLETKHLLHVYNITQGKLYHVPAPGVSHCTVSGGVITFEASAGPVLASGDILHIQIWVPNKGSDLDGYPMVHVLNPEYAHSTSPIVLVAEEDETVDNVNRYVLPFEEYKDAGVYVKLFADSADDSVFFSIWVTNDTDADDSADTGWVNVTDEFSDLANSDLVIECINDTVEFYFWIQDRPALKYMIKLEYGLSSSGITENNSADVIVIKA